MKNEDLVERLLRLRNQKGISQTELASRAGITQKAISDIETGKRSPHKQTLASLALALGVTVRELTGQEPEFEHNVNVALEPSTSYFASPNDLHKENLRLKGAIYEFRNLVQNLMMQRSLEDSTIQKINSLVNSV